MDPGDGSVLFGPVFSRLLEIQQERGIINYDDMVYFAVRILLDDGPLRRKYRERSGTCLSMNSRT